MKNITVSVPEDVYRKARLRAAERGSSVSALVAGFLERLASEDDTFAALEALQDEVWREIREFSGSDRVPREQVHDRALR